MLMMDRKAEIRHAVLVEEKSRRQVARDYGHSRNTIRKMLTSSEVNKYTLIEPRPSPILGPYQQVLEKWVEEDEKKPKKKRRTARRMYRILEREYGYKGAESTLRRYVGQLRKKARKKIRIPLAYEPGETGQADFGEAEVIIAGKPLTAHLFVFWLGYSGATFVQAYPAETQEVFFEGHVATFEFFGGAPREIWYDNPSALLRTGSENCCQESAEGAQSGRTRCVHRFSYPLFVSGRIL